MVLGIQLTLRLLNISKHLKKPYHHGIYLRSAFEKVYLWEITTLKKNYLNCMHSSVIEIPRLQQLRIYDTK